MRRAGQAVAAHAPGGPVHLWVLEQNTAAQLSYTALGGTLAAVPVPVPAPGGDPARLNGSPRKIRVTWPDAVVLAEAGSAPRRA
jgi:hypothetical protein